MATSFHATSCAESVGRKCTPSTRANTNSSKPTQKSANAPRRFTFTGGTPNASRVGNVINVPDPTTVLMVPAATPASAISTASSGLTPRGAPRQREARPAAWPAQRPTACGWPIPPRLPHERKWKRRGLYTLLAFICFFYSFFVILVPRPVMIPLLFPFLFRGISLTRPVGALFVAGYAAYAWVLL